MRIRFIPFEKLPYSDTCWSLIEGPDDCVYAAACNEFAPGGTVFVLRYDPRTEQLDYLIDVAEAVGEPAANGRATQCKIHYSMVVDDDGTMYGATHLSGPAVTEVKYNPWGTFDDPLRSYVGARVFAYDCGAEDVLWTDTLIPWEGCRCVALDRERRRLYAVGYPRDHFYCFDIEKREGRDFGRIGSVNPQAVWLDARGRAYTTDDYGRLVVFDPDQDRLIETDIRAPHASYQDGWHNVVYDVVQVPGSEDVVGVAWNADPCLFRFSPGEEAGTGTMRSLGPASPGIDGWGLRGVNTDHAGGLVFTAGGDLLFGLSVSGEEAGLAGRGCVLKRMNIETGKMENVCTVVDENDVQIGYVSRAVRIGAEHLVLGIAGQLPTGIVHVVLDGELAEGPMAESPRRYWG